LHETIEQLSAEASAEESFIDQLLAQITARA
jgi:hypothetical protein